MILQEPEESDEEAEESAPQDQPTPGIDVQDWSPSEEAAVPNGINGHAEEDPSHLKAESTKKEASPEDVKEVQESKDWLDLSLLEKLDALHLVTEWQFQNPHRLRTFMKDDDESANWVLNSLVLFSDSDTYVLYSWIAHRTHWIRFKDKCVLVHRS